MIDPAIIKLVGNGPDQVIAEFRLDPGIGFYGCPLGGAEQIVRESDKP
jgi:hypothetical protein